MMTRKEPYKLNTQCDLRIFLFFFGPVRRTVHYCILHIIKKWSVTNVVITGAQWSNKKVMLVIELGGLCSFILLFGFSFHSIASLTSLLWSSLLLVRPNGISQTGRGCAIMSITSTMDTSTVPSNVWSFHSFLSFLLSSASSSTWHQRENLDSFFLHRWNGIINHIESFVPLPNLNSGADEFENDVEIYVSRAFHSFSSINTHFNTRYRTGRWERNVRSDWRWGKEREKKKAKKLKCNQSDGLLTCRIFNFSLVAERSIEEDETQKRLRRSEKEGRRRKSRAARP